MSDLEDSVDAYLDLRDQLEEAEAERDRLKDDFENLRVKLRAMTDHRNQLREALEKIKRHHTCSASVADIATDALAGGSESDR